MTLILFNYDTMNSSFISYENMGFTKTSLLYQSRKSSSIYSRYTDLDQDISRSSRIEYAQLKESVDL